MTKQTLLRRLFTILLTMVSGAIAASPVAAQKEPSASPPPASFSYQVALADDAELKLEGNNATIFANGTKALVLAVYKGRRGLYVLDRKPNTGLFDRQSIQPAPDGIQGTWMKTPAISPDGQHLAGVINQGGIEKLVAMTRSVEDLLDFHDPTYLLDPKMILSFQSGTPIKKWHFWGDAAFTPANAVQFNIVWGGVATETFQLGLNHTAKDHESPGRYNGSAFSDLKYFGPHEKEAIQYWNYSTGPTPQTDGGEMIILASSWSRGPKLITMKFLPHMPLRNIPGAQWVFPMKEYDPVKWAGSVGPVGSFYQGVIKTDEGYKIIVWPRAKRPAPNELNGTTKQ